MEEFQFNISIVLTVILSLIFLWSIINLIFSKPWNRKKLPPSPWKLPIIGNLHQLSSLPHRDLHSLSRKLGPFMLLHFGSVPVLIISSAEAAREITRTHDLIFANRPEFKAMKKLFYNQKDVGFSPYGQYWRKVKSIFVLQLLSSQRVRSFASIREEETALFVNKVQECCSSDNLIGKAAFDRAYGESEKGRRFMRVMKDMIQVVGIINIGDFIPWLDWINRFNGFDKRLDEIAKEMDEVLEGLIHDREKMKREKVNGNQVMVDTLLEIYNDKSVNALIDRDSIKSLLLDVYTGGTDTVSITLEWTMSEILQNPTVMEELQREVRGIVKEKEEIRDEDLEKMHYLKAVMKEALRLHPPIPLLVPRVSSADVQIKGFDVSAGTVVMINVWAIARDPIFWDEPEKFKPERFLNSSIDFKGQDFEFLPFGVGRRGCPGITFSIVAMEFLLANLMQKFDWKLDNGVEAKDLDMNESPGISMHKVVPLLAIPSPIK